jgi:hypothetical protein
LLTGERFAIRLAFDGKPVAEHACPEVGAASLAACALIGAVPFEIDFMEGEPIHAELLEFDLLATDKFLMAFFRSHTSLAEAPSLFLGKPF